jgi:hypothetical protein
MANNFEKKWYRVNILRIMWRETHLLPMDHRVKLSDNLVKLELHQVSILLDYNAITICA